MRLIDADELMEIVGRRAFRTRDDIHSMIESAPTVQSTDILEELIRIQRKINAILTEGDCDV